jgi:pyruvate dehydrogenase E1 component alpha subunit
VDLSLKAAAYEIPAWPVDGMDVLAVEEAARKAAETVRRGGGPVFLELRTYRFRAHSMYDPELYRDKAEVEHWKERDPISTFADRMIEDGVLDAGVVGALDQQIAGELDAAVAFAEGAELEAIEDLTRFVYSEGSGPR